MFSEAHNDRLMDRNNATGLCDNAAAIGDNSAEIGDNTARIAMSPWKWSYAKLCPEWRLE